MDSKLIVLLVLIILVLIMIFISRRNSEDSTTSREVECRTDGDCLGGVCQGGICIGCTFSGDCGTGNICISQVCEPSTSGRQVCLDVVNTGNLEITSAPTDFGDLEGAEDAFIFLGTAFNSVLSQTFSATWDVINPVANIQAGGFLLKWGPTAVKDRRDRFVTFHENIAAITYQEYQHENGFGLQRAASIPLHEYGSGSNVQFKVTPIAMWQQTSDVNFSIDGTAEEGNQVVHVDWQPIPVADTYFVSVKAARIQVVDPLTTMEVFPTTYAYHGLETVSLTADIPLPAYYYDTNSLIAEYGPIEVKVYGYKNCNIGGAVTTSTPTQLAT